MNTIGRIRDALQSRWLSLHTSIGQNKEYRRIYFYHIQKAGGSSVRRSFYNLAQPVEKVPPIFHNPTVRRAIIGDKVYVSHHVGLINQGLYFFASSHLPMWEISLPSDTFTFTCVRHPVKRFLSRYRELLFFHERQSHNFHLKNVQDWFSPDFMTMMGQVPDEELLFQLNMFSQSLSVDEAVRNVQNLSYYFLTSDMTLGVQFLAEHLNLPLELYHDRKTQYDYEPTLEQMAYLEERLQPEIEMYEQLEASYLSKSSASS